MFMKKDNTSLPVTTTSYYSGLTTDIKHEKIGFIPNLGITEIKWLQSILRDDHNDHIEAIVFIDGGPDVMLDQLWLICTGFFKLEVNSKNVKKLFLESIKKKICFIFNNVDTMQLLDSALEEAGACIIISNVKKESLEHLEDSIDSLDLQPKDTNNFSVSSISALHHASNYLQKTELNAGDYDILFKEKSKKLGDFFSKQQLNDSYQEKKEIATTLAIALDHLNKSSNHLRDTLGSLMVLLCTFNSLISKDILTTYFRDQKIQAQDIETLLNLLQAYGIIAVENFGYEEDMQTITLDPLTQSVWREWLIFNNKADFLKQLKGILHWINNILAYDNTDPISLKNALYLIPHALTLCSFIKQKKFNELDIIQGKIFLHIALHHSMQSGDNLLFALQLYQEANDLLKEENQVSSMTIKKLSNEWGMIKEHPKKRLQLLLVARPILERYYLTTDLEIGMIFNMLGEAYLELSDVRSGKEYLEKAFEIKANYYGTEHIHIADLYQTLANAYCTLGDYDFQKDYLEKALAVYEKQKKDKKNLSTLAIIHTNLGNAWGYLGNYHKQVEYLKSAMILKKSIYGENHIQTLVTQMSLGVAYGSLGYPMIEKDILESVLTLFEVYYKNNLSEISVVLDNLGSAWGKLGEYAQQKEYLTRSLQIKEKMYHPKHPQLAVTLTGLAISEGYLGNHKKKLDLLTAALSINEAYYGRDHSQTCITLTNLGNVYGALENYEEQKKLLAEALLISEKYFGENHAHTSTILTNLANSYGYLGHYAYERTLLERAYKIKEACYGLDHQSTKITRHNLGICDYNLAVQLIDSATKENPLEKQQRLTKAKNYLNISLEHLKYSIGLEHKEYGIVLSKQVAVLRDVEECQQLISVQNESTNQESILSIGAIWEDLFQESIFSNEEIWQDPFDDKEEIWEDSFGDEESKMLAQTVKIRATSDFTLTLKSVLGSSLSRGLYAKKTGELFFGKSNSSNQKRAKYEGMLAIVANRIYNAFNVPTPAIELSDQKMDWIDLSQQFNTYQKPTASTHIMSPFMDDLISYKETECFIHSSEIKYRLPDGDEGIFDENILTALPGELVTLNPENNMTQEEKKFTIQMGDSIQLIDKSGAIVYLQRTPYGLKKLGLIQKLFTQESIRKQVADGEGDTVFYGYTNSYITRAPNWKGIKKLTLQGVKCIPEKGLGRILAVGLWLNDMDIIGDGGTNIGFKQKKIGTPDEHALTIKIDSRAAFSKSEPFPRYQNIGVALSGTQKQTEINFNDLPSRTRKEFKETITQICETSVEDMKAFFSVKEIHHTLKVEKFIKFLQKRQLLILLTYKKELPERLFKKINPGLLQLCTRILKNEIELPKTVDKLIKLLQESNIDPSQYKNFSAFYNAKKCANDRIIVLDNACKRTDKEPIDLYPIEYEGSEEQEITSTTPLFDPKMPYFFYSEENEDKGKNDINRGLKIPLEYEKSEEKEIAPTPLFNSKWPYFFYSEENDGKDKNDINQDLNTSYSDITTRSTNSTC